MSKSRELRYVPTRELRATTLDGVKKIGGYAAVYNSRSCDLGGFVEIIKPGAFQSALTPDADVLCLRDHEVSLLMGRTKSGTLTLSDDEVGLKFDCTLPSTDSADALYESISRGDIDACSFGFYCNSDEWEQVGAQVVRTVLDVELLEVSAVSFPAYASTSVSTRSAPAEIRSVIDGVGAAGAAQIKPDAVRDSIIPCNCPCAQCAAGACNICSVEDCSYMGCTCPDNSSRATNHSNDVALAAILARRIS